MIAQIEAWTCGAVLTFEVNTHPEYEVRVVWGVPDDPTLILLPDSLSRESLQAAVDEIRNMLHGWERVEIPEFCRRVAVAAGMRLAPDAPAGVVQLSLGVDP